MSGTQLTGPVRWGILGAGRIAAIFAHALRVLPDQRLVAVASRAEDRSAAFAATHGAERHYSDYAALAADPGVDIIYVATPHVLHAEHCRLALEGGKAVLCEKPFTMNAGELQGLVELAQARGLLLVEGMWTRFLPATRALMDRVVAGDLGDLRLLQADFGYRASFDATSRSFDPALGGGALLDLGVYTVSYANMLFGGEPTSIATIGELGETGVDEQAGMILQYGHGQLAMLTCAIRTSPFTEARLIGTAARARIPDFYRADGFTLYHGDDLAARVRRPKGGRTLRAGLQARFTSNGYQHEAAEVARCWRAGLKESPIMPLADSLAVMRTMDRIREAWGLRYPGEAPSPPR